ncbi:MAG: hypothetical protein PHV74_12745 [Dehalococcoidia bacterium]|nr:hypothetical protein [Dehalococcoidia bacterium]
MPFKDKELQREYQRQWQRDRRAGVPSKRVQSSTEDIRTAKDMLAILGDILSQLKVAELDLVIKARVTAYVVSVGLRATETAQIEERLQILEDRILKGGGNGHHKTN